MAYAPFDDIKKEKYLDLLRDGIGRSVAIKTIGLSRQVLANHRNKYPEFKDEESRAEVFACERVENALFQSAIGGNVTAIQVWLYNRMPDRWSDRRHVEVSQRAVTDVRELSMEELHVIAAQGIAAGATPGRNGKAH